MASPASDMMLLSTPKRYIRMNEPASASGSVGSTVPTVRRCSRKNTITKARQNGFLGQRLLERVDGLLDDGRAVVEGHDADLRDACRPARVLAGSPASSCGDLVLDPAHHLPRVLAVAHEHHAADGLDAALVERAAPEVRPQLHRRDVPDPKRRAAFLPDDDPSPCPRRVLMNPTPRMKNSTPLFSTTLAPTSMLLLRTASYTSMSVTRWARILSGCDVDLVLLDETADAGDFAHAFHRLELVADVPVLDGAQLGQIEALAFDRVPVDLAQSRRVRTEARA